MPRLPPISVSLKKTLIYSALIFAVAVSFLFGPRPTTPADYCGRFITLGRHMGFNFNCDAPGYMTAAHNPGELAWHQPVRQSRPLYILTATVIGYPIQWLMDTLHINFFYKIDPRFGALAGFYAAYILLNFLLLLGSLYLFDALAHYFAGGKINKWLLLGFQLLLASNIVTKAFFWTPHQQFFATFTPLLTIYLCFYIKEHGIIPRRLVWLSLICGVCMLLYGNFLPMFGCLLLVSCVANRNYNVLWILACIALFLLPSGIWMAICIKMLGGYYNHEMMHYRQLIWVADTLKISFATFWHALCTNTMEYLRMFRQLKYFIAIAVLFMIYITGTKRTDATTRSRMGIVSICFAVFFIFLLALGYYNERLAYTLYAIILCLLLLETLQTDWLKKRPVFIILVAVCWHLYILTAYGPFS